MRCTTGAAGWYREPERVRRVIDVALHEAGFGAHGQRRGIDADASEPSSSRPRSSPMWLLGWMRLFSSRAHV